MTDKRQKAKKKKKIMPTAVLRESLFKLTGEDHISAMILNQLIYWNDVMDQADQQTLEAIEALEQLGDFEAAKKMEEQLKDGWFWKSAKQLSKEIMCAARPTVQKRLQELEKKKFIQAKRSDQSDQPKTYKVNLGYVKQELRKLGYTLDDYLENVVSEEQSAPVEEPPNDAPNSQTEVPHVLTEQGTDVPYVPTEQGGVLTEQGVVPTEQGVVPTEQGGLLSENRGMFPENNLEEYYQENTFSESTGENTSENTPINLSDDDDVKQERKEILLSKQLRKDLLDQWFNLFGDWILTDDLIILEQEANRLLQRTEEKYEEIDVFFQVRNAMILTKQNVKHFKKGPMATVRAVLQGTFRFENTDKINRHLETENQVPVPVGFQGYNWVK